MLVMMNPEDILTEKGLKLTEPRLLVLGLLMKVRKPVSIEDMQKKLRKESPDRVTLYRMMDQYVEKGIVRRIDLREGFERYEFQENEHHHHIACTTCERVEHIENKELEKALLLVQKHSRMFRGTLEHDLEFFGRCKKCLKK